MSVEVIVALVLALATTVQSLAGFGMALVSMPFLVSALTLPVAAPLFAIVAMCTEVILIFRYRHSFTVHSIWRLSLGSMLGIPIGIWGATLLPENLVTMLLGVLLIGYALYGFASPHLPELKNPRWGYAFGAVAGLLSGAYNTGGPPYVIYGTCRRWEPQEFKVNLQTVFFISSVTVIAGHTVAGRMNADVLSLVIYALIGMGIGLTLGGFLERFISPRIFKRLVLAMLLVIGLTLIF